MEKRSRAALIIPSVVVSRGIETILEESGSFHVIGTFHDFSRSDASRLNGLEPDIVILDPAVFDAADRKRAREYMREVTDVPVAVVEGVLPLAMEGRFEGSLSLMDEPPAIVSALRHAMNGPQDTARSDASGELSVREKEILVCVAKGMLNKEIADKFNISIYTVITHRKNITHKTGIKTVAGLTVYALLNNLIDLNCVE